MRFLTLAVVTAGLSTVWAPAWAGPSNAVFANTDSTAPGSVFLTVNGGSPINATVGGSYDQTGGLVTGPYLAGVCGSDDGCLGDDLDRRNFFSFNLANLSGAVTGATLTLYNPDMQFQPGSGLPIAPGYISGAAALVYTLHAITAAIDPVTGATSDPSIYADILSGVVLGSTMVSPANDGAFVTVTLNAAALAGITAAEGGTFALGGVASAVATPEPMTIAVLSVGFSMLAFARRARR